MKGTRSSRASRAVAETGIKVPRWGARTLINPLGGDSHHHSDRWNRSRQEHLSAARRECRRQARIAAVAGFARLTAGGGGHADAMRHRHGRLRWRPPPGAAVCRPGPNGAADDAQARRTLPHQRCARQERRGRRRTHLRGRDPAEHALRTDQVRGAAAAPRGAPRARASWSRTPPRSTASAACCRSSSWGCCASPRWVHRPAGARLESLPTWANMVICDLLSEVRHWNEQIALYDAHSRTMACECKRGSSCTGAQRTVG